MARDYTWLCRSRVHFVDDSGQGTAACPSSGKMEPSSRGRSGASWMAFGFVSLFLYLNYRSKVSHDEFGRDHRYCPGAQAGAHLRSLTRHFHAPVRLMTRLARLWPTHCVRRDVAMPVLRLFFPLLCFGLYGTPLVMVQLCRLLQETHDPLGEADRQGQLAT